MMSDDRRPFAATTTELYLSLILDEIQALRADIAAQAKPVANDSPVTTLEEPVRKRAPRKKAATQ
mgnify:CR=1 FL=1